MTFLKSSNSQGKKFDLHPTFVVEGTKSWEGYQDILSEIKRKIQAFNQEKITVVFDYYHGIDEQLIQEEIIQKLNADWIISSNDYKYPEEVIQEKFGNFITEDRINGVFSTCKIVEFFNAEKVAQLNDELENYSGLTVVYGVAASAIVTGDLLIYGNVSVQTVKDRYLEGMSNWGASNETEEYLRKEKRYVYLEGRIQDNHKRHLLNDIDFIIDGDIRNSPVMLSGEDFRSVLHSFAHRPFKLTPFFNKGIWGGNWCQQVLNGGTDKENTAWGITGWMNLQSAVAVCGENEFHVAGNDIIHFSPTEFLGNQNFFWFGYNCPVSADYLDTWGGGNLSLQVHPDNAYGQEEFNAQFGHYESYYMMDTCEDSSVYLGTKEGVKKDDLVDAFTEAQSTGEFDEEKWLNKIPMKKHQHVFIPSGTVHASGKNTVVLEINPYWVQTFKLWDWGRVDADGKPRPINIEHGAKVIQEKFATDFVEKRLISKEQEIARGDGWVKEHSGLMEYELMTVDRYWFTKPIFIESKDHVKLLILVEGVEALLYSPNNEFEPIVMHYAEAVFAPASLGQYVIKPCGESEGEKLAVLECYMDMGNDYGK